MIDIKNKTCLSEWCDTQVRKKYDGYCYHCFIHLFPEKSVSKNYRTKENSVVQHIKVTFPDYDWIVNKVIFGGCSRRRPDLLLDLGYQVIIIEIDENQHAYYDTECENRRMMEIYQDLGHRNLIILRFNPDNYKINNKNITSCWDNNSVGLCRIKRNKQKEWSDRLKTLEFRIRHWIATTSKKMLEVEHLFFDQP